MGGDNRVENVYGARTPFAPGEPWSERVDEAFRPNRRQTARKCQVLRTRRPTGLDALTLTASNSYVKGTIGMSSIARAAAATGTRRSCPEGSLIESDHAAGERDGSHEKRLTAIARAVGA